MCLLFLEVNDSNEKEWHFETHMVGDRSDPIGEEDRKRLQKAMNYIMANAMLIYEGHDVMPPEGGTN